MAGKHAGVTSGNTLAEFMANPPVYPGTRRDRAYAEGRRANEAGAAVGTNPAVFGSPEFTSWANGWAHKNVSAVGYQLQTATDDT